MTKSLPWRGQKGPPKGKSSLESPYYSNDIPCPIKNEIMVVLSSYIFSQSVVGSFKS